MEVTAIETWAFALLHGTGVATFRFGKWTIGQKWTHREDLVELPKAAENADNLEDSQQTNRVGWERSLPLRNARDLLESKYPAGPSETCNHLTCSKDYF